MSKSKKIKKMDIDPIYLKSEERLDIFLSWASANPELAKQKYPVWHEGMRKTLNSYPVMVAYLFDKLPQIYLKWIDNASKVVGTAQIDALKYIISTLGLMRDKQFLDEIVEHSRLKAIPYINEYIDQVNEMLNPEPRASIGFK